MLTLIAHGNARIEFELNPCDGRYHRRFIRKPLWESGKPFHGYASVEPVWFVFRRFYAVYANGRRLWFQAGRKSWDVTDGVEGIRFWVGLGGMVSGLSVKFNNGEQHTAYLFHPGRALSALVDPTYDQLDAESDHFFMFLREGLPKEQWRSSIIERTDEAGK